MAIRRRMVDTIIKPGPTVSGWSAWVLDNEVLASTEGPLSADVTLQNLSLEITTTGRHGGSNGIGKMQPSRTKRQRLHGS